MYFTNGSSRAFEMLMRGKPGFDRYENGGCADCEDCNTIDNYYTALVAHDMASPDWGKPKSGIPDYSCSPNESL